MTHFIFGVAVGIVLSASLGLAGTFYGKDGSVKAPAGSVERFDYYRFRQEMLDVGAIRRQMERDRIERQISPCGK
jgi:hypothetical protein